MIVCEAIMNKIEDFKQNSLKRILYSQTLGEPRYYFIIEGDFNKENIRYWNNIEVFLPQQDEFKNSGLEITVGTESDWENNHFKFGWNEIPF
jgi:hypothetical protein